MRFVLLALSLVATQATASAPPPCGCAPFDRAGVAPVSAPATDTPQARALRDFVLYSHRKIADDLVRREGAYLETLLSALAACPDKPIKLDWLRRTAADTVETPEFADRIARAYAQGASCGEPARVHP